MTDGAPTTIRPEIGRASLGQRLRDAITDALRYWEPRRLAYNAVLALIVLGSERPLSLCSGRVLGIFPRR